MSLKLNQLVAVEKGTKTRTQQELTQAHHALQKNELLNGIARTYLPKDAEGDQLPSEATNVQVRAEDMIAQTATILTELFDTVCSKDITNCFAKADVVLPDGKVLITDAPVSFLLFLEKQLVDIHTFVKKLPILDPGQNWHYDASQDCFATDPQGSVRTKKVMKNHVKAEATDKHPAQIELFHEDIIVGTWTTVKYSGALEAKRAKALLGRVETLQKAVKYAREQANMADVQHKMVGEDVFSYLFDK